jgi:hypothetical protein
MKNLFTPIFGRSRTVDVLGLIKNLIFQEPSIEHLLFYRFLMVSKSYEMAHLIRTGKIKKYESGLGKDLLDVLRIYDLVGDIYQTPFTVWWAQVGQNIFYQSKTIKKLTLTIDLSKDEQYVQERVKNTISKAFTLNQKKNSKGIEFMTNKIRVNALFHKLEIIRERARLSVGKNFISNWRIGVKVGFGSKYIPELLKGIEDVGRSNEVRSYLGIFISQKFSEANLIAENAARGNFPSKKPLESMLDFDYRKIYEILKTADAMESDLLTGISANKRPLNYHDALALAISS